MVGCDKKPSIDIMKVGKREWTGGGTVLTDVQLDMFSGSSVAKCYKFLSFIIIVISTSSGIDIVKRYEWKDSKLPIQQPRRLGHRERKMKANREGERTVEFRRQKRGREINILKRHKPTYHLKKILLIIQNNL